MKKNFFFIIMVLITFTVTGCGNSYLGKQVKSDMTRKIQTPSGKNHRYTLNHFIVDYNYTTYPGQQMIIIRGTIDDRQQDAQAHFVQDAGWILEEAYLDIYFLNADRRAVDFCRKSFPLGHFAFPYPFEVKCSYNPSYQHASLSYKYKYVKYPPGGKVDKIYQHILDIE
ncbi:MAG: hypothetical protein MUP22_03860 [Desulfobacterales bacterium]|nr:hypothetical protein [Desulfobacterales bacterium]